METLWTAKARYVIQFDRNFERIMYVKAFLLTRDPLKEQDENFKAGIVVCSFQRFSLLRLFIVDPLTTASKEKKIVL